MSLVEAASISLGILLTGQKETEKNYGDKKERDKSFYHMVPKNEAKTVSKKVQESYRKKMQKKEVEKSARRAKKAYEEATKGVIEAIKAISKVISEMMANIAESMAANPVVWIVLIVIILLIIIVGVVATIVGGTNHVGIYCGTLKNGTKVWLHCTSKSGTSLTGNDSGVMFGSYTGFTYFRRLKDWSKTDEEN